MTRPRNTESKIDRNSYGTPSAIIEMARDLMGSIDLDPASNAKAQAVVKAHWWFGQGQIEPYSDGLKFIWTGAVWLNPPYGKGLVRPFIDKLLSSINEDDVTEACVLINCDPSTKATQLLLEHADAVWFPSYRIAFLHPETGVPVKGNGYSQMLCYFSPGGDKDVATCDYRDPRDDVRRKLIRTLAKHNLPGVVR